MSNLIISNIAWNKCEESEIFNFLSKESFNSLEIAITKYFDSWDIHNKDIVSLKQYFDKNKISIYSIQSIFFNTNYNIFSENKLFEKHFLKVINYSEILGAKIIVFGSPKNRIISQNDNKQIFIETMHKLSSYCGDRNLKICIEPNSKQYGCNFITNSFELADILKQINKKEIRMHLDSACMHLEKDSPSNIGVYHDLLEHFHISEPYLGDFDNPSIDHYLYSSELKKINYNKYFSIEMRACSSNILKIINAIKFANKIYN